MAPPTSSLEPPERGDYAGVMPSERERSRGADQVMLRDFYYPVAQSGGLGAQPIARSIAGRAIALFRVVTGPVDAGVDNFFGLSHVPFVHGRTFGGRHAEIQTWPVTRRDDELGFSGRLVARYHYGVVARLFHGSLAPYTEDVHTEVTIP